MLARQPAVSTPVKQHPNSKYSLRLFNAPLNSASPHFHLSYAVSCSLYHIGIFISYRNLIFSWIPDCFVLPPSRDEHSARPQDGVGQFSPPTVAVMVSVKSLLYLFIQHSREIIRDRWWKTVTVRAHGRSARPFSSYSYQNIPSERDRPKCDMRLVFESTHLYEVIADKVSTSAVTSTKARFILRRLNLSTLPVYGIANLRPRSWPAPSRVRCGSAFVHLSTA